MIRILLALLISLPLISRAQTNISGVINSYAKVTVISPDACKPEIEVDDPTGFNVGDVVMIIQMQGATVSETDDANFGAILDFGPAGLHEKNVIASISGNGMTFTNQFANNYEVESNVQIVTVPQYEDVTITGEVTALPWDGDKGGIIAFEATGTTTLNANINATGAGFRGGVRNVIDPNNCSFIVENNSYFYDISQWQGSVKGEGIAIPVAGKEAGRGAWANGGGGGNDHNTGGGGGSYFGAGGTGGLNDDPNILTCQGPSPGEGGRIISVFTGRFFLGGGGGAGHDNDDTGTNGGNGGGIIYIRTGSINPLGNQIRADGNFAFATGGPDGAGGGGGGGCIYLKADNLLSGGQLQARGGGGGNVQTLGFSKCMGPGGGGGGGAIYADFVNPYFAYELQPGSPGVVENTPLSCNGTNNGALAGSDGLQFPTFDLDEGTPVDVISFIEQPEDVTICTGESADFSIDITGTATSYQWELDNGSGFTTLADNASISGSYTTMLNISDLPAGVYTIQAVVEGGCTGTTTSEAAILEIVESPAVTLQPVDTEVCAEDFIVLATMATGAGVIYQWQVNDGTGFVDVEDGPLYNGSDTDELTIQAEDALTGYQYQCVITSSCPDITTTDVATITIGALPVPDFTFYVENDTLWVVNNSDNFDTYYWDYGEGGPLLPAEVDYYVFDESGTYNVTIYAVNECGTSSTTYPVSFFYTSASEILDASLTISPNPTDDLLNISFEGQVPTYDLFLFDISGKEISIQSGLSNSTQLSLSELPSGIYHLSIITDSGMTTRKVVKN